MSSFKTFYMVTRPLACLTTLVGTWGATVLFSKQLFAPQNIAAAFAMMLFCLASSLYYAAMAHKSQQDSKISGVWLPLISGPAFPQWKTSLLKIAGIISLIGIIITAKYLPASIFIVILYTTYLVYSYTKLDGSEPYWLKRSIHGAGIAACCVMFGGMAVAGPQMDPTVPNVYMVSAVVFFLYLLREILKHIQVASLFSSLKNYPINVGEDTPPANLGSLGMLGMIALACVMPLGIMLLPMETWKYLESPNLIIGKFIASSLMVFLLWFLGIFITGLVSMFDKPPQNFRPIRGSHYLVTGCVWLMTLQAVLHVM